MDAHNVLRCGGAVRAALQCQTHPPQRILVVEDEPDIRQLESEVLRESGYQVDTAENGLRALDSLNADHYDLLIIEEEMSTVTGLELVNELRSEGLLVPVILVLGTMPTEGLSPNPWPQVQAILLKPYTVAELFRTVREVLCAASGGAHVRYAPPANWQSPVFSSWLMGLTI